MFPQTIPDLTLAAKFCSTTTGILRIRLVGRDPLVRAGLVSILGRFDDLEICEEMVSELQPGAAHPSELPIDAVLCDLPLGMELVDFLHVSDRAVVLVGHPSVAAEALAAGARGVLLRTATPKRIHAALRSVAEGLLVIDDELSGGVLPHPRPSVAMIEPLTGREREVMQHLASGLTNKEIAQRLGISEHTAKFHVNGILGKLGVDTRTEAVVHAARLGIVVL